MAEENEMKLLITIVLNLLIALAFLATYEVKNNISSPNPFIIELFLTGIIILSFAFISYTKPESKLFRGLTYFFVVIAIILFLNLFLNRYHESISFKSDKNTENLYESFTKIRVHTFLNSEVFQVTLLLFILIFIILIYQKLKENKSFLHNFNIKLSR